MSELKACPFCGGKAAFIDINGKFMIECKACDGGIDKVFKTIEQATTAWNTRTEPEPRALTLEELRKRDQERVWVQFPTIGMYGLVSYLTNEEYSNDEEYEQVWITNSLGGRDSYDEITSQGGKIYDRESGKEKFKI